MRSDRLKKTLEHLRRTLAPPEEGARTDGQLLASFVATRDESAFAALMHRHGRMVFGVCRRVLGHIHDAEDAFQATFLVLARKASSLRNAEAVANWLYGVAFRTALEAKTRNARRRGREQSLDNVPPPEAPAEQPRDWLVLLERAVSGLPERYRTPLVLCHLQGHSRQVAARQLGLPEGTLSSRLATARQLLAKRLARHRLALSMGVVLTALSDEAVTAALPSSLIASTVQDALRIATGQPVTTPAAVLMKEVLHTMLLTKVKLATVFLAMVGVMSVLTASFFAPMRAADEKRAEPNPAPAPAVKKTLATKITHRENDIGDVASVLHITKHVCAVELQPLEGFASFSVVVEVYKDGKKRNTYGDNGVYSLANPTGAEVALFASDLDYLPLANAPKNHFRMQINVNLSSRNGGGVGGNNTVDVPKEMFDFSRAGGSSFSREAASATEVPLFWLTARSKEVIGMPTVSGVIEKNSKGDLLIAYLRLRKE